MIETDSIGKISKITGSKVLVVAEISARLERVGMNNFDIRYISIGSLIGTMLVDGRTLVLTVEEILDTDPDIIITTSISGIYDEVTGRYSFGTNTYPLIGEKVFRLGRSVLTNIFQLRKSECSVQKSFIGTYAYDSNVKVGYDPNILFGKHLGVFGNTGSGKTCTVVSIIQQYIRNYPVKDIKFIILDVNGEYKSAFEENDFEYIPFDKMRFHHTILDNSEYGRLFRAAEGTQYPALKSCIRKLAEESHAERHSSKWNLELLPNSLQEWINDNANPDTRNASKKDQFSVNQISGYMRTLLLRIDEILKEKDLLQVINSSDDENTLQNIEKSNKRVFVLDLERSSDTLDIVLYLLFKTIYLSKIEAKRRGNSGTHLCLVLEEAHRYLNPDAQESKLGTYYIDKLSREGRKFGIGLIISSQVPSMLSYDIVSQCNSVIMHKITSRKDMDFLRGVLRISSDSMYTQMSALEKQYALVCGEAFPNDALVKINDANPLPNSNDPVIGDKIIAN